MERRLQTDAQELLAEWGSDIKAETDGLVVTVTGAVDTAEDRYAVLAQLKPMHGLATIRPNVKILDKPRFERKLAPGVINLNSPGPADSTDHSDQSKTTSPLLEGPPEIELGVQGRKTVIDVGLGSCADLQLLDPSVPCSDSSE
ncbi:MAG: hypothetical protein AB8B93_20340 [Pseudomonadales bacterium]